MKQVVTALATVILALLAGCGEKEEAAPRAEAASSQPAYPQTTLGKRVALVIGNSHYEHFDTLANPSKDAAAVAERLAKLGFELIQPVRGQPVQDDLTLPEFIKAEQALEQAAQGAQIAFLYYAGHGAQLGRNSEAHLLPVDVGKDMDSGHLEMLERQSYNLNELLGNLNHKAELTVAVFDACREIPELNKATRGVSGGKRGLSRIAENVGSRQIVAYAGAAGAVVPDGANQPHSPYTTKLLEVLDQKPTQEVGNLFRDVASRMENDLNQQPEVVIKGVPPDKFYLTQPAVRLTEPPEPPVEKAKPIAPPKPPEPTSEEKLQQAETWLRGDDKTQWVLAIKQLEVLAEAGNADAGYLLGGLHYLGRKGMTASTKEGCGWYKTAEKLGHTQAKDTYAKLKCK